MGKHSVAFCIYKNSHWEISCRSCTEYDKEQKAVMLLRSFGLLTKVVVLFTVIVVCLLDLIVSPCIEVASFKLN